VQNSVSRRISKRYYTAIAKRITQAKRGHEERLAAAGNEHFIHIVHYTRAKSITACGAHTALPHPWIPSAVIQFYATALQRNQSSAALAAASGVTRSLLG
jgi:hypothetical protein